MKKLIMLSFFALGSVVSFADNGHFSVYKTTFQTFIPGCYDIVAVTVYTENYNFVNIITVHNYINASSQAEIDAKIAQLKLANPDAFDNGTGWRTTYTPEKKSDLLCD